MDVGDRIPAWEIPCADASVARSGGYEGHLLLLVFLTGRLSIDASLAARLDALDPRLAEADTSVLYILTGAEESFWAATRAVGDAMLGHDADGSLARTFDSSGDSPQAFVIDRAARLAASSRHAERAGEVEQLVDACGRLQRAYAAGSPQAPVLTVPRVLSPDDCAALVSIYERGPRAPSQVSDVVHGKTALVVNPSLKVRHDAILATDDRTRFARLVLPRLQPEIERSFSFLVTHYDGLKIGCYDAGSKGLGGSTPIENGFFGPHRDNKNAINAHWRFAVSLNLNDDYEGGFLRFPEFGDALFKPEPGGAVVFSCSLLHEATPVISGRRFVLLTFLYDKDDAARGSRLNGFGGYPISTAAVKPPRRR